MLLLIGFISPVLMAIVAAAVVLGAKWSGTPVAPVGLLFARSASLGIIGALAMLVYTIASMIWYERTTGFSAGNGPLGWIFFYGPLGVAFGQFVALLWWWHSRPRPTSSDVA